MSNLAHSFKLRPCIWVMTKIPPKPKKNIGHSPAPWAIATSVP